MATTCPGWTLAPPATASSARRSTSSARRSPILGLRALGLGQPVAQVLGLLGAAGVGALLVRLGGLLGAPLLRGGALALHRLQLFGDLPFLGQAAEFLRAAVWMQASAGARRPLRVAPRGAAQVARVHRPRHTAEDQPEQHD